MGAAETTGRMTAPLLRFPENIRDRIWTFAYGDLVIHTEPACVDQRMKFSGDYPFTYVFCQQLGQSFNSAKVPECCPGANRSSRMRFYWPIVCHQFWTEAIKIFYATATFKVTGSIDLYILASSQQQSVRCMRNLEVRLGLGIKHHNRIWSLARCESVIKRFENLQSLALWIGLVVDDDSNYTGTCFYHNGQGQGSVVRGSRLEGPEWREEKNWFPMFLRAFQMHDLQADRTRVALFDRQKSKQSAVYHEKDPRKKQDAYFERQKEKAIQANLRQELATSMRACLLGQRLSLFFPDQEAENQQLLDELTHK